MAGLHWVGVSIVTLAMLALLLWGLRRDPRASGTSGFAHGPHDDEHPTLRPFGAAVPEEHLTVALRSSRRFLTHTWGADTPDLTVAWWAGPLSYSERFSSFHQAFLPLGGPLSEALSAMESHLYEGAEEQEVPERSRLRAAWTFIHLPARRQDLVVQSHFADKGLEHHFFLMDSDGKLERIQFDLETPGDVLLSPTWMVYRGALASLLLDEDISSAENDFADLAIGGSAMGRAHAWLAHIGNLTGRDSRAVRRHVAFSLELDPTKILARIEKGRLGEGATYRDAALDLRDHLSQRSDEDPQTGFLLAQSLTALRQDNAARGLCEVLLMEANPHEGLSRLRRRIDQRERGAQT